MSKFQMNVRLMIILRSHKLIRTLIFLKSMGKLCKIRLIKILMSKQLGNH
jgi:hypothetical protein